MLSKLFWYNTFAANEIPQPTLHASCIDGVLQVYSDDESTTDYIRKPDVGSLGMGVERVTECGECIQGYDWICQERVPSCGPYTQHYRVVTLWDGRLFSVSVMTSSVIGSVTSNLHQGGTSEMLCFGDSCSGVFPTLPTVLQITVRKLMRLHNDQFSVVFSIGWDVIVSCDQDENPTEAAVLEGNLKNGGRQWSKRANILYRDELRSFLFEHPEYK
jgi:hypothetical protein